MRFLSSHLMRFNLMTSYFIEELVEIMDCEVKQLKQSRIPIVKQDLESYKALKDGKLKDKALKNKAIMEGIINEDDESNNEVWRRRKDSTHNHDTNEYTETDEERYDEYVAINEYGYNDLTKTNEDAYQAYQEIFCRMDEGWVIYWKRGDDEVKLTNKESSIPDDEILIEENEVAKIFRIETNVFNFETPTCRAFKEFNYLLQINLDVLTKDIDGFKTYEEYKDDWIYE
nr:hypothetical protein [Tanacetum cinerariifolium]